MDLWCPNFVYLFILHCPILLCKALPIWYCFINRPFMPRWILLWQMIPLACLHFAYPTHICLLWLKTAYGTKFWYSDKSRDNPFHLCIPNLCFNHRRPQIIGTDTTPFSHINLLQGFNLNIKYAPNITHKITEEETITKKKKRFLWWEN